MASKCQSTKVYRGLIAALLFWGIVYISAGPGASSSSDIFHQRTSSSVTSSPQFATYFGGSSVDDCDDIAVDAAGSIYLACHSTSKDFPGFKGRKDSDDMDAFISKLDPRTGKLIYTTRLGGSAYDGAFIVEVCKDGSVFVAGITDSPEFPTTDDAIQRKYGGGRMDIFLAKLKSDGLIEYSTYLGGDGMDFCSGLVVDSKGTLYMVGYTSSESFPGVRGRGLRGGSGNDDGFIGSLNFRQPDSLKMVLLGGSGMDGIRGIALDNSSNLYVSGVTQSTDFPVKSAVQDKLNGNSDAFLSKLRISDLSLISSTFLGGSREDSAWGIAIDRIGNPHLAGSTSSADFPVTAKAFQRQHGGGEDAFVTKFDAVGTRLLYSTYIGGEEEDAAGTDGEIFDIDSEGNAWMVGVTKSRNFPISAGPQTVYGGGDLDGFTIGLDPTGSRLKFSSYYGGDSLDRLEGLALAADGSVWVTGFTAFHNLAVHNAIQKIHNGGEFDAMVVKIYTPDRKTKK
jgi:Beta-propeller repeat